ncbi:phosphoenolpyruvate--protein phosphotransferase [Actinocrispum sp. NPDC049592]|uniref:phosphoenolpyruvate--protein phosphotransferase n=1 Tax=Actinocrispum sp. NPDC049592 TaxID=3154835 RepID=UPI00344A7629
MLSGVGVSPGRAAGPVVLVTEPPGEPPSGPAPADLAAEAGRIGPAAELVAARLQERAAAATGDAKTLLETTAMMAADPSLRMQAEQLVASNKIPAARAVHEAASTFMDSLRAAGGYMAERVRDVEDVRDRLVAELLGVQPPGVPTLTEPSVLLARDLAPADTAVLDPSKVLALVTEEGGPTSHTAILARSLGIPAVVAVQGILAAGPAQLIVDGEIGTVEIPRGPITPFAAEVRAEAVWNGKGALADGMRIKVLANVGSPKDAQAAADAGAEGVGLFRTEFCYLDATDEPTVDDQRKAYAAVLAPFHGKPIIVRTLDAGADKPLAFLNPDPEINPALGVRGIRISKQRPEVLNRQLEAIVLAANETGVELSVMAPMVATVEEAAWFVDRAHAAGVTRAGVMIEVPAAALVAEELFGVVDFISIGTNDLAQYTLAADRQLGAVAALNDPWQPALLRLIAMIGKAAGAAGKPAGVCGEAAADPLLAGVLVGLGISSLSMNAGSVRRVGAALARHSEDFYRQVARAALVSHTPADAKSTVRAMVS